MFVRIITALVGIPIALAIMYYGKTALLATVALIILLGLNEYHHIMSKMQLQYVSWFSYVCGLLFPLAIYFDIFSLEMLYTSIFLIFTIISMVFGKLKLKETAVQLFGIFYIAGMSIYLLKIRFLTEGFTYLLLTFLFIWMSDSAAYFVGRFLGRNKLAPNISPNKTIEGSIGGLVFTIVLAIAAADFLSLPRLFLLGMALVVNIIAQTGDLVESAIKRQANVKDSGNVIPGHGGILDRFDSAFFTAPVVYYYLSYFIGR